MAVYLSMPGLSSAMDWRVVLVAYVHGELTSPRLNWRRSVAVESSVAIKRITAVGACCEVARVNISSKYVLAGAGKGLPHIGRRVAPSALDPCCQKVTMLHCGRRKCGQLPYNSTTPLGHCKTTFTMHSSQYEVWMAWSCPPPWK